MGVVTILVMWPAPFEQTFISTSQGDSIWNLSLIGWVVSEEMLKMLMDGRTNDGVTGILIAHPWAFVSGELIISIRQ